MTEPLVCGVLLTADRPAMTARAIRCFEAQTYSPKTLLVLDSGNEKLNLRSCAGLIYATVEAGPNHGELCNLANSMTEGADIIAHFDSDDWSSPERLADQVGFLCLNRQISQPPKTKLPVDVPPAQRVDCVGYNDMLFWDSTRGQAWFYTHHGRSYTVGASQCYWREAWVRQKFQPLVRGADNMWQYRVKMLGVSVTGSFEDRYPRMICEIHGGNVSSRIDETSSQWTRVPEWDDYCRERMAL